jgi:bleomycin hydrolase
MAITLGEPPKTFHWSFRNKNKEYQSYDNLTPLSFYKDHITRDVSQWISLIHDPRNEYNKLYTVDYLGNVIGGRQVLYLNVPIQELKKYSAMVIKGSSSSAKKEEEEEEEKGAVDKGGAEVEKSSHQPNPTTSVGSSKNGEPVWFGCDVGKFSDRSVGIMDLKYYDYNSAYDINFGLNKANRLRYGESAMTHAMTLNAVDIIQDEEEEGKELKVRRWRVENSWGEDRGENGYFTMTDDWFDEYVYQVVIDRNILSDELKKVLDTEKPIVFPPWDPLGALA